MVISLSRVELDETGKIRKVFVGDKLMHICDDKEDIK